MPEALVETQTQTESLGWRAGLPGDLQQNADVATYKTVGDFAKDALSWKSKAGELEGKLKDAVPKLPDDASDEDRGLYYDALGRPKQPSEYEFDGEDKNAPEWTNQWKQTFHKHGLTKTQANALSKEWNGAIQRMVEAHNAKIKTEITQAETALKSKWGDKFSENVELAKRVTQKKFGNRFDKYFDNGSAENRWDMIDMIVEFASMTGEDRSPQASSSQGNGKQVSFIAYDKSPEPPKK